MRWTQSSSCLGLLCGGNYYGQKCWSSSNLDCFGIGPCLPQHQCYNEYTVFEDDWAQDAIKGARIIGIIRWNGPNAGTITFGVDTINVIES